MEVAQGYLIDAIAWTTIVVGFWALACTLAIFGYVTWFFAREMARDIRESRKSTE